MTLIKKPNEIQVHSTLKALIYGQAGTGKTTLALSAPKPLLLDFDGGVSRLNTEHRVDTVQISCWGDCTQVLREDLSAYQTIVVDTVGKMIDCIIEDVCKGRIPMIKDWGAINNAFTSFCRQLHGLNKHVIFVAHRDNRKEGDKNVFVPAIREKNYNSIVSELDLMGYIESRDDKREITFDFSDRNDGKNTCNLPRFITIPTIVDRNGKATSANNFFTTQIINPFSSRLNEKDEIFKATQVAIAEIKEQLVDVTDDLTANEFANRVIKSKKYPHVGNSEETARKLLSDKVKKLNLTYNQENQQYEPAV